MLRVSVDLSHGSPKTLAPTLLEPSSALATEISSSVDPAGFWFSSVDTFECHLLRLNVLSSNTSIALAFSLLQFLLSRLQPSCHQRRGLHIFLRVPDAKFPNVSGVRLVLHRGEMENM